MDQNGEILKTIVGKVVVLGHQGVGKTSTVTRYIENSFAQPAPTIWDTAGQERFKAMAPMFYRNANAALLVFDITNKASFDSMKDWVVELRRNVEVPLVLCVMGNKTDLETLRQVSRTEALQYSQSIGAYYSECSALRDQGIQLVFEHIAHDLYRLISKDFSTANFKDGDNLEQIMARSSELEPTDIGKEEMVNLSIGSIAHGKTVKSRCC